MTRHATEGKGQLHTLSLLEQLRRECKGLWGTSSEIYFRVDRLLRQLADPNLSDIPSNLPFRVEMWERDHLRLVTSLHRLRRSGMPRLMWRSRTIPVSGSRYGMGCWSYGSIRKAPNCDGHHRWPLASSASIDGASRSVQVDFPVPTPRSPG
jgi:hypothetical protein